MLNVSDGIDRYDSATLHIPPPQEIPMPVKLSLANSANTTAKPSFTAMGV
jgi:hypothetical protein